MKNTNIYITGATSGIGLAIKNEAEKRGALTRNFSSRNGYNLLDENAISEIIKEVKTNNPNYLFLNSGIASFGPFNELSKDPSDIFGINTIANIKIISALLEELKRGLKIIVTLSTASYINGANEAVYNASKKAMKEYIVSVNTELVYKKINNRIFMFIPHKVEGTLMTSSKNENNEILKDMVSNLFNEIINGCDRYIPKYESIYKKVFERYVENPIQQGIESIEYRRKKDESN